MEIGRNTLKKTRKVIPKFNWAKYPKEKRNGKFQAESV